MQKKADIVRSTQCLTKFMTETFLSQKINSAETTTQNCQELSLISPTVHQPSHIFSCTMITNRQWISQSYSTEKKTSRHLFLNSLL